MIVGGPKSLAAQLTRITEQRIFDREWSGHDADMMLREYGPYDNRSIFVAIVDHEGVAAAGRTIWSPNPQEPTKAEVDLEIDAAGLRSELDLERRFGSLALWEIATVAIEPRARQSEVIGWLVGEMRYQEMSHNGLAPSVAIVASAFFRMMQCWGIEIEELPGTEVSEYLGVMSQPALLAPGAMPHIRSRGIFARLSDGLISRLHRPLVAAEIDLRVPESGHLDPRQFEALEVAR